MDLLCSRLLNFRLLEAAGICDSVAASPNLGPVRSSKWWRLLATVLRNYRSALSSEAPATISEFVLGVAWCDGAETEDIAGEISRTVHEFRRWQTEVPGGEAYIAFVHGCAYVVKSATCRVFGVRRFRTHASTLESAALSVLETGWGTE